MSKIYQHIVKKPKHNQNIKILSPNVLSRIFSFPLNYNKTTISSENCWDLKKIKKHAQGN